MKRTTKIEIKGTLAVLATIGTAVATIAFVELGVGSAFKMVVDNTNKKLDEARANMTEEEKQLEIIEEAISLKKQEARDKRQEIKNQK